MSDLREALESAVEEHTEPTTAPVEVAVSSDAAPTSDAPQDAPSYATEQSDSVPEKADALPSIEEVAGQPTDTPSIESKTQAPTDPRSRVDRAPQSWKGDAKKVWEQLPLQVRQEVARREREITTKLNEVAPLQKNVAALTEVLAPHRDRLNQMYQGNPLTAINNLLGVERTLVSGSAGDKAQLVARMIKNFNIDIATLDDLLSGGQMSPQVQQQSELERLLEQKLAPMQQFIQNQQQVEQRNVQRIEQEAVHTVESMAQDDRYPYFSEVRDEMADLIEMSAKRGVALSLEQAYSRAVRMNDDTFQASSTRNNTQAATNAALSAHQEAQRAKGAALSVSGAPSGVGTNFGNPSDLRGTIAAALGNTGGRV